MLLRSKHGKPCRDSEIAVLNARSGFAVTFSLSYLSNATYANLQSRVGFIFEETVFVYIVLAYFFAPHCQRKPICSSLLQRPYREEKNYDS